MAGRQKGNGGPEKKRAPVSIVKNFLQVCFAFRVATTLATLATPIVSQAMYLTTPKKHLAFGKSWTQQEPRSSDFFLSPQTPNTSTQLQETDQIGKQFHGKMKKTGNLTAET
jgi:hypothetical protein